MCKLRVILLWYYLGHCAPIHCESFGAREKLINQQKWLSAYLLARSTLRSRLPSSDLELDSEELLAWPCSTTPTGNWSCSTFPSTAPSSTRASNPIQPKLLA
ncbi:hypothetical protein M5D96_007580 [Drosophila gunungcola]|uniref:Secreted protein n=1 Tax=Drosophila gunungcola TaxID=103775 RepID=A0A9P9YN89_9MUSC|nr:hypothetical protein M5D96_007580 [Drosophila gunungcola]